MQKNKIVKRANTQRRSSIGIVYLCLQITMHLSKMSSSFRTAISHITATAVTRQ